VGFGGRFVPAKRRVAGPRSVSFAASQGSAVPSALVDEDAEAAKQKAAEEKKEEAETFAMAGHEKPTHVSHVSTTRTHEHETEEEVSGQVRKKFWLQTFQKRFGSSLDEPPLTPEQWVEDLADKVEISRLLDMGVLKRFADYDGEISGPIWARPHEFQP